ncbi:GNAT family N-acetyltransferase [Gelidibacter mesophilus]|uniref:GNAT family N-acetyltransferase n=1 Tax=Gelidibacter mesophilus TaxID=169050 RepID=UPI00041828A6|nr:GNAT family N-acetyltransferase [Gelidibacter mesophilus]
MEIKRSDNGKTGLFYVELDGKKAAEMTYKHSGDQQITIVHTAVNDALKGQGVGHQLIHAAVDYLRENNLKAVAQCAFVKSVFDKKSEAFDDIIA